MDLKKKSSRSIAIALVVVSMITPILNTVSANEVTETSNNIQVDLVKEYDKESRLGGGPSPSAAWTYSRSYKKTLTESQLNMLSSKYQSTISSNIYKAGDYAYKVSVAALGLWGGKPGAISSTYIGIFGKTHHSEIQRSANVIAKAASRKRSVTLNVKEYIRPASGQKMILFY